MSDEKHITQIDNARLASLAGRWAAAVCVTPEGTETYWLISPDEDANAAMGCACATCAPHEQKGPYMLPATKTTEEPSR